MYRIILAVRYLRARKITYFSILGVSVGVMALIVVLSVMEGFQRDFKGRIKGMLSDIIVRYRGDEPLETVLADIEALDHVVAASPRLRGMALLSSRGRGAVETVGIDPDREGRVSELPEYVKKARLERTTAQALLFLEDAFLQVDEVRARIKAYLEKETALESEDRARLERKLESGRVLSEQLRGIAERLNQQVGFQPVREAYGGMRRAFEDARFWEADRLSLIEKEIAYREKAVDAAEEALGRMSDEEARTMPFSAPDAQEVILGEELARGQLKALVGETVQMVTGSSRALPSSDDEGPKSEFKVVGTFKSGMYKADSKVVYLPLKTAQVFSAREGMVSEIGVRLDDFAHAPEVKAALLERFPGQDVRTWAEHRKTLLQAIHLEKAFLAVILFMIIVVAGFNMLATFLMLVSEKTRDLGILMSLGGRPGGITAIFLLSCTLIGVIGAGLGTAAGLAIATNINAIEGAAQKLGIPTPFPRGLYYLEQIPVVVELDQIMWIVVPTILFSVLLGGVLPAWKASRLNPLDALRYE